MSLPEGSGRPPSYLLSEFEEMTRGGNQKVSGILPVPRTRGEARQFYDRISRFYDCLTGTFERKYAEMALERLSVEEGEIVLEIGFGSGRCLGRIAQSVGQTGKACGIDISGGMLEVTKRRLKKRLNSGFMKSSLKRARKPNIMPLFITFEGGEWNKGIWLSSRKSVWYLKIASSLMLLAMTLSG